MELQNTSGETRIWPSLQFTDGTTLELAPGEIGDVAVDEVPEGAFLSPAPTATAKRAKAKAPAKAAHGASGPDDAPQGRSDVDPTAGSADPSSDPKTIEPAAEADGKEA